MSGVIDNELALIEQVVNFKKSLVSCLENERPDRDETLCAILKQLQGVNITKQVITKSGIGSVVGKLRKSDNASVSSMATTVVNSWKSAMRSNSKVKPSKAKVKPQPEPVPEGSSAKAVESPVLMRRNSSVPAVVKPITGERRRDVMISKFNSALMVTLDEADAEVGLTEEEIEKIAIALELALYTEFGEDENQLKAKFLQLVHALRDKQNGQLRLRVVVGHVLPEEFIQMSVQELANVQLKAELEKIDQYHKEASKLRKVATQVTDRFGQCAKCRHKIHSYFMMQTRSADEPMTIFISCVKCGHAWRK